jgi:tetratricopeptide (TPR) repeat protein
MPIDTNRVLARQLALAGNFGPEALALNRSLIEHDESDEEARTRLARCLRTAGRLADAEAEYREVLRRNPQNRIAAGALEALAPRPTVDTPGARGTRRTTRTAGPRGAASPPGSAGFADDASPVPQSFSGFRPEDFLELQTCPYQRLQERFGPRMIDLVRRVNTLASSAECAAVRDPQQRQLFRASLRDVHTVPRQVYVFNLGGRWEPQFNLGAFGGRDTGNWFRIGLGFDLSQAGRDADAESNRARVRGYFRRFQDILRSDRRHLLAGWMAREDGLIQVHAGAPRRDLESPGKAADFIAQCDVERTDWVFCGKWLFPDQPDDAAVLADPVALVRTVDRVLAGLRPLYGAILGAV